MGEKVHVLKSDSVNTVFKILIPIIKKQKALQIHIKHRALLDEVFDTGGYGYFPGLPESADRHCLSRKTDVVRVTGSTLSES